MKWDARLFLLFVIFTVCYAITQKQFFKGISTGLTVLLFLNAARGKFHLSQMLQSVVYYQ